jgi:hypothetical protein
MDDVSSRLIHDLLGRVTGPMKFRPFCSQSWGRPTRSDGLKDARQAGGPTSGPSSRMRPLEKVARGGLEGGLPDHVLGVVMDVTISSSRSGRSPARLVIVVFVLACLPWLAAPRPGQPHRSRRARILTRE